MMRPKGEMTMTKLYGGWAVGLIILFATCVIAFDGALAAALWQLSGICWVWAWYEWVNRNA